MSLFSLLYGSFNLLFAQSNFAPLSSEDIEEKNEIWALYPGLKVSADYRLHAFQIDSNTLPPREEEDPDPKALLFEHELRVNLRSSVHRNLSINLEIEINQESIQDADFRSERVSGKTTDSQVAQIQARQAFLEYNSNPRNILRVGKQPFNIGDRQGKVFSGILTGLSQNCAAGTWCYELAAAKLGNHPADWLYLGSLDYPVFEDKNSDGTVMNRLNVEIFRIFYTERDVPLGKSNGSALRDEASSDRIAEVYLDGSEEEKQNARALSGQIIDRQGRPLYYDALQQQYFGLRLEWEISSFFLRFDITSNQGIRKYHLAENSNGNLEKPDFGENSDKFKNSQKAKRSLAGVVSELEMKYQLNAHQFGFRGMVASGDKEKLDTENTGLNFLRTLNSYYEIAPGSYRGTNFYFNGGGLDMTGGTGLGHSVSNTSLWGGWYRWDLADVDVFLKTQLFKLSRTQSVYNEVGDLVEDIGLEWDNTVSWKPDKNLNTEFEVNAFQAGKAFTLNDNQTPIKKNDPVIQLAARVYYSF
ncbi:MAG: hypothetical protein HQM13_10560 [SAR324 cluster bacterium]|nr:hypothetical protein [SAR324 cluster bacterium]